MSHPLLLRARSDGAPISERGAATFLRVNPAAAPGAYGVIGIVAGKRMALSRGVVSPTPSGT